MNVTKGKIKDRQLHTEGHLQMVSAEQREYAEASACLRIAENTGIITDLQTTGLLEGILQSDNLNKAYKKVKSNKGFGGCGRNGRGRTSTVLAETWRGTQPTDFGRKI